MKVAVVAYYVVSEESIAAGVPVPIGEHDVGEVLDVTAEQGQFLVARGYAVPVDGEEN